MPGAAPRKGGLRFRPEGELKTPVTAEVAAVGFSLYSQDELRALSVVQVTNPECFDALGQPTPGGLYDPRMGPLDQFSSCATCGLVAKDCPGHIGRIELVVPAYHPTLYQPLIKLLRAKCWACHHIRCDPGDRLLVLTQLQLLTMGAMQAACALPHHLAQAKGRYRLGEKEKGRTADPAPPDDGTPVPMEDGEAEEEKDSDDEDDGDAKGKKKKKKKTATPKAKAKPKSTKKAAPKRKKKASAAFRGDDSSSEEETDVPMPLDQVEEVLTSYLRDVQQAGDFNAASEVPFGQDTVRVPHQQDAALSRSWTDSLMKSLSTKCKICHAEPVKIRPDRSGLGQIFIKERLADDAIDPSTAMTMTTPAPAPGSSSSPAAAVAVAAVAAAAAAPLAQRVAPTFTSSEDEGDADSTTTTHVAAVKGAATKSTPKGGKKQRPAKLPAVERLLTTLEALSHVRELWRVEEALMSAMFGSLTLVEGKVVHRSSPDMFFLHVMPVPPNRFRPPQIVNGERYEHAHTSNLARVVSANEAFSQDPNTRTVAQGGTHLDVWIKLQQGVSAVIEGDRNARGELGGGVRQELEKKEGLFRKHMMGKRVNYAARSVISPDPNLDTSEIGVPLHFAKVLTFPETVTPWNVHQMQQFIENGPDTYPGANFVEDARGVVRNLSLLDAAQRKAIANTLLMQEGGKHLGARRVFRHLLNGDVLLLNRQPTLHRPGIMSVKTRVLMGERVLRMHYANCNTFNADFDGDEMNLHLVQNHGARAEGYGLALADKHYLGPADGSPLRGLIQDHVVSGIRLTCRDTFLTEEQYQQLVYGALSGGSTPLKTAAPLVPPAVYKPRRLWTGKQVVTSLLLHVLRGKPPMSMISKAKVSGDKFSGDGDEGRVEIHENELVSGAIGKGQFGASSFGLIHQVFELYSSEEAGQLLSSFGRLFSLFLQMTAFSCGIDDLMVTASGNAERAIILRHAEADGIAATAKFVGLPATTPPGEIAHALSLRLASDEDVAELDGIVRSAVNSRASQVTNAVLPGGQVKGFPENHFAMMTISGAKGKTVNFSQISCLLGQQELEGRRVPMTAAGRTLPSFAPFDPSPRAGGFVSNRFLTGVRPQEFFFHCMAGREGLVDTAVKTSRSGYLQRCLIKHLESLRVHYDHTVRDSDGSVIQFLYGEDGIDVGAGVGLTQFDMLARNILPLRARYNMDMVAPQLPKLTVEQEARLKAGGVDTLLEDASPTSSIGVVAPAYRSKVLEYIASAPPTLRADVGLAAAGGSASGTSTPVHARRRKRTPGSAAAATPGVVIGGSTPTHTPGSRPGSGTASPLIGGLPTPALFQESLFLKWMRCQAEPGEAVGLLAAQSIGEPSTQMTLNTFHLAGHGAANVTLGIPRLREILMTAAYPIKTPSTTLPLLPTSTPERGRQVAQLLKPLHFVSILNNVVVKESLVEARTETAVRDGAYVRSYAITLDLSLLPKTQAHRDGLISWEHVLSKIYFEFLVKFLTKAKRLRKTMTSLASIVIGESSQSRTQKRTRDAEALGRSGPGGKGGGGGREDGGGDDDEEEDGGETTTHRKKRAAARGGGPRGKKGDASTTDGTYTRAHDDQDEEQVEEEDEEDGDYTGDGVQRRKAEEDSASEEEDSDADDPAAAGAATAPPTPGDPSEGPPGGDEENRGRGSAGAAGSSRRKGRAAKARAPAGSDSESDADAAAADDDADHDDNELSGELARLQGKFPELVSVMPHPDSYSIDLTIDLPLTVPKLLFADIIEAVARRIELRVTPGITGAFFDDGSAEKTRQAVVVQGSAYQELFALDLQLGGVFDFPALRSNDIGAVLRTYGVEACHRSICREVAGVFQVYGISVDYRHLSLIADYMTFFGGFRPMNRAGMMGSTSPFQQMSFETSIQFLMHAVVGGRYDLLTSPSAAIVMGKAPNVGTGAFELVQPADRRLRVKTQPQAGGLFK